MGTKKDPNAKKASLSRSARHRTTTKPGDTTRSTRLATLTNSRKPATTSRPTKSPLFPPPTATTAPLGAAKPWQAWETELAISLREAGKSYDEISRQLPGRSVSACEHKISNANTAPLKVTKPWQAWETDLMISLREAGKSYDEISQQLPGRSSSACRHKMLDLSRPQQQGLGPQQKDDDVGIDDSKSKWWEPWEEKLLVSLRKTGKTYIEITKQLPGRSVGACRHKIRDMLESQKRDLSPRQNDDLVGMIQDKKRWQAWEEELLISLFKIGKSWDEISQQLPDRSEIGCRGKIQHLLDAGKQDLAEVSGSCKVWKDWEEKLITTNHDAGKSWEEISKLLPSRTKQSVWKRWKTHLKPRIQKAERWSQEEDQLLIILHAAGEGWARIAQKIPNRSMIGCEGRWQKLVHCYPELSKNGKWKRRWTKLEKENLVSLVNAIGPRYYDIAKELPGRTAIACELYYKRVRDEVSGTSGPSREYWLSLWDNPEETEMASSSEQVDLNAEESTSAPPTLKRNQQRSFNAKKRQAIHVPMV